MHSNMFETVVCVGKEVDKHDKEFGTWFVWKTEIMFTRFVFTRGKSAASKTTHNKKGSVPASGEPPRSSKT